MTPSTETSRPPEGTGPEVVSFWRDELDRYKEEYTTWHQRAAKIIRRYRDERPMFEKNVVVKYAVLWSNVQTLKPAIYAHPPTPVVERRFLDQDKLASVSSQTLERCIDTNIEIGHFDGTLQMVMLDYLLPGRAQVWMRYEPTYADATAGGVTDTNATDAGPKDVGSDGEEDEQPTPQVTWEKVCTDYVHWSDFAHTPARTWPEVWWVGKRAWLTREEGVKRFGEVFAQISLKQPGSEQTETKPPGKSDRAPKAEVWEIWDKVSREVFFMAPDLPSQILERVPDPLRLSGFFPCPEPLYATLTNDTLVPVPDYIEYQDQAEEIDSLTARIAKIANALKVVGLYDGSVPALARLLNAQTDNVMIAVDSWAALAEKGGVEGATSWMPIKDLAVVLMQLYEARETAKRDLFEITGMSDIIRGQASGAAKTATEQRIKGQFASMRLEDRRKAVQRFIRDIVAIIGEIIAEHFSPETIIEMSGMLPNVAKQIPTPQMAPTGPQPGVQPQGQLPAPGQPGMAPHPPAPDPQMIEQQKQMLAMQVMQAAIQLLRDDKMRTFRIDIETDSTVEADAAEEKENVVEFMGAMAQFLTASLPIGQMAPPLIDPLVESFLYAARRFRMGRSVETAFEQAFEKLKAQSANPAQGEDPKAAAEKQKAESELQVAMIKASAEIKKQQMQAQLDEMEMQFKQRKMELDAQRMEMEFQMEQLKLQQAQRQAAVQSMIPANGPKRAA